MAKIRHVAIFTLKPGADASKFMDAVDRLRSTVSGFTACAYGVDAGLKTGNADFGLSFDFDDEAAYQRWDTNVDHDRIRRDEVFPLVSGVMRVQFRLE